MARSIALKNNTTHVNIDLNDFKNDVLRGFVNPQKSIASKYFYDSIGSELFTCITHHPDYYLTNCEIEILNHYKKKLAYYFQDYAFNLIELGPGEGIKTAILLKEFMQQNLKLNYVPIDISLSYLNQLEKTLKKLLPGLNMQSIHSDYFSGIQSLSQQSSFQNIVLFLGSSIGNFDMRCATEFLRNLSISLSSGDYVLIGFDLKKDLSILKRAYDDAAGFTRKFNLNLLSRINRELGGHFNLENFFHYPNYNVSAGAMESFIVSKSFQEIDIDALSKTFTFEPYEAIHVEYSFKYHERQLFALSELCQFEIVEMFYDSKRYFVDALWRVK